MRCVRFVFDGPVPDAAYLPQTQTPDGAPRLVSISLRDGRERLDAAPDVRSSRINPALNWEVLELAAAPINRPIVTCLSTLQGDPGYLMTVASDLTSQGHIVLWDPSPEPEPLLQLKRIDVADELLVVNRGGIVTPVQEAEAEYAQRQGRRVRWLEYLQSLT